MESNVGSIFRSAETAGVTELITCGITCHPPHPKLLKTALSSIDSVPTRHFDSTFEAIRVLKEEEGYTVVVMETTSRSEVYSEVQYPVKTALVVGNEVSGVDTRIIEIADKVVQIPTYGMQISTALSYIFFSE